MRVDFHIGCLGGTPYHFSVGGDTDRFCDQLDIVIQNTEHNKVSAAGESFQSSVNSFSSVKTVGFTVVGGFSRGMGRIMR